MGVAAFQVPGVDKSWFWFWPDKMVDQPIERLGLYGLYREGGIELPKSDGCIASQNRPSQP
jgi:hypothetical protein